MHGGPVVVAAVAATKVLGTHVATCRYVGLGLTQSRVVTVSPSTDDV